MTVNPLQAPTSEVNAEGGEVLRNFVETYKALPELWNPTNPMYLDKTKRNIALDKLLNIYVELSLIFVFFLLRNSPIILSSLLNVPSLIRK
jgi:hypothetical protein